ncbi:MAG: VWA domain-containing protein [Opitutus sp.]|nr:VWA domain-containing protein [Opitutus sp.]
MPAALWWRHQRGATGFLVPHAAAWHRPSHVRRSWWPVAAAITGLVLIIVALARPQRVQERWVTRTRGYDIILAVDLSTSMLTEDYRRNGERINRFEAIKPILRAFVGRRPDDRIGVVLFAGKAYTLFPLTFDHAGLARRSLFVSSLSLRDATRLRAARARPRWLPRVSVRSRDVASCRGFGEKHRCAARARSR